jgi:hypothetical protein
MSKIKINPSHLLSTQIKSAIRFAGQELLQKILDNNYKDGFTEVKNTTSTPKPDGGLDIVFKKDKEFGVVMCCFPENNYTLAQHKAKIKNDLKSLLESFEKQVIPYKYYIAYGTNQELTKTMKFEIKKLIITTLQDKISSLEVLFFDNVWIVQELQKPLNIFLKSELLGTEINSQEYNSHSLALIEKYRISQESLEEKILQVQLNNGLFSYPDLHFHFDLNKMLNISMYLQGKGTILDLYSYTLGIYINNQPISGFVFDMNKMKQLNCKITKSCGLQLANNVLIPEFETGTNTKYLFISFLATTSNGQFEIQKSTLISKPSVQIESNNFQTIIKRNYWELVSASKDSKCWTNRDYVETVFTSKMLGLSNEMKNVYEYLGINE